MAKIVFALILVMLIEIAVHLFGGSSIVFSPIAQLANNPDDLRNTAIYQLLLNPAALAVATSAIIAGLVLLKNDTAIYAAFAASIFTFGIALADLWKFIYAQTYSYLGTNTWVVCSLIVIPLVIQFGWAAISIVGNRPD